MKRVRIASFLSVVAFFFLPGKSAIAQSTADDSMLYKKAVNHLINLYQQSSGDQTGLLNGFQYASYPFKFAENHPFFLSDEYSTGNIEYNGIEYDNVLMKFDEVEDALVIDSSSRSIQLINERIDWFVLFGNTFIRLVRDTENTVLVRTGFYHVLYNGKNSVLKKEEKVVREDVTSGEVLRFIDVKSFYYIKKNNSYYNISSKNNLFSVFADHKKELKQFIRKNQLSYRKDRDNTLIKATAYYDQITK